MAERQVTVFGGSGFLGRHVVHRLIKEGWRARVAVRHPERMRPPDLADNDERLERVTADVRDYAQVRQAVDGSRAVVNTVGLYIERGDETFDAVHVAGAERVGRLSAEAGVTRLIHISGIGVDPDSESSYVRARDAGEILVRRAFADATVLRPSVLFGAEDSFFTVLAALSRLLPALPLFGGGDVRLQPVHVADVARAVGNSLEMEATRSAVLELGGPRTYSYRELMRLVLEHTGRKRLLVPIPFPIAGAAARALSVLPQPPLTRDQLALLKRDNVVGDRVSTFADLDIQPSAVEDVLPTYLPGRRG